ncbi:MAG: hypothetical protein ACF8Q5_08470 [Phycisphaerales bacterium JB040]
MNMSISRFAAGAAALAFVAGTASAQLEYYALSTDGSLIYADGLGNVSVVGNTGLNNSVNSLSLNWASRGGNGQFYTSEGFTAFAPPTGVTSTVDVGTGAVSDVYTLSDSVASLPLGGGIAHDADGNIWQISQDFAGPTRLFKHDSAGNLISSVNVNISGAVGALFIRSDGRALVGGNDGTIYTVNTTTGQVVTANSTGQNGLTEFSTGAIRESGYWTFGTDAARGALFEPFYTDVAYAVTNRNGVSTIWRMQTVGNNPFVLEETIDLAALGVTGNIWGLQVVPTPASAALLGLGGLAATRRRRS